MGQMKQRNNYDRRGRRYVSIRKSIVSMSGYLFLSSISVTIILHFRFTSLNYNPYPQFSLDCPSFPDTLPDGIQDVRLFYHVGMRKNWEEIVRDQLVTLEKCGLAHYAKYLTITHTNGDPNDLKKVLDSYHSFAQDTTKMKIELIPGPNMIPWEATIINAIHDTCHKVAGQTMENKNDKNERVNLGHKKNVVVFYFHNKGASKYDWRWKGQLEEHNTYGYSLYWRKYLEYFTLERPNLCLTAFSKGAFTCGAEFHKNPRTHYSGNFWSASCEYIFQSKDEMKKFDMSESNNYTAAELWIGNGYNLFKEKNKFIGLIDDERNMYTNILYPSEYKLRNELEAIEVVAGFSKSLGNHPDFTNILRPLTKLERNA